MIWWIIAATLAFFVKGLCGFANTLVFTTVLSFGNTNKFISPIELLLGYPTNLIMAYRERKSIDVKTCLMLSVLMILGAIPGVFLLKNADTRWIKLLFGIVIVGIGCEMLLREYRPKKTGTAKLGVLVIGILSGILCGLYGVGALLGAYLGRVTENSHEFKANICVVFFIENTFRIVMYCVMGIITPAILKTTAMLLPFVGLGLWLGIISSSKLDERVIKKLVIIMLIISGIALVVNCL